MGRGRGGMIRSCRRGGIRGGVKGGWGIGWWGAVLDCSKEDLVVVVLRWGLSWIGGPGESRINTLGAGAST